VIERNFASCLRGQLIKQVKEFFAERRRRYERATKEGRTIGDVKVIFYDLPRLVEMAHTNSRRHGRPFCEYLKESLGKTYHEKGGSAITR